MALARKHDHLCRLSFAAATSIFLFSLVIVFLLPLKSDGGSSVEVLMRRRKVVGSSPPTCTNKCMNCKPCLVTLVIPPHYDHGHLHLQQSSSPASAATFYRGMQDDSYYLLTWRCRCENKFYQP